MPRNPFKRRSTPTQLPTPPTNAPTQVVTDNPTRLDARKRDLYQQTINVIVTGKGMVRRAKRGLVTYGHGKMTGLAARDFWVFAVAGGVVITVAGAVAFAAIGWWALIPGLAVGIIVALVTWYFSKKWTKHTVAVWLKKMDEELERNPDYLPPVDLEKDGPKVEAILTVLMNDHMRLETKLRKYYGNDETLVRRQLKKAFRKSAGRHDLSTTLHKIKGSKVTRYVGTRGDDVRKLSILIARERAYLGYTRKYLKKLEYHIKKYYDDLGDVDRAVDQFVQRQISLHPHHENCEDQLCFGPSREDLNTQPVQGKISTIDRESLNKIRQKTRGIRRGGTDLGSSSKSLGTLRDEDALSSSSREDREDTVLEYGTESGSQLIGTGAAAISEALEGTLVSSTAEALGGTAGDLIFSPIGFVVGVTVGELVKTFTVNLPTQKKVGKIRKAVHDKGGTELDDDIKKQVRKGKSDMLTRALNKVHGHYLKRMSDRFDKLQKAYDELRTGPNDPTSTTVAWPHTCTDAANMTRYLLKVYHYCEKAYAHIIFVAGAIQIVDTRLQRLETLANTAYVPPAPPGGP